MTSITVNLTLEQVLEFVQNLPLEYKQAVKQKLEEEKVEIINKPKKSILDEIAGIIKDDNLLDYKTLRDAAIVENYKQKS